MRPATAAAACGWRIWRGSAKTVVACSPSASGVPSASKIVPRPPGSTTVAFVCACARFESEDARTVEIQAARASSTPKVKRMQRRRNRSREFTTRATGSVPPEVEVARVRRRRRHQPELACRLLDTRGGPRARHLRGERLVLRLELELLLLEPAHAHVHAQHRHVDGDD